jgi:hypothetical protein
MALSIYTLRQETYKILNEASNSTLGQLPSGTGGADTASSDVVVRQFLLEGIADLCRSCVYYEVSAVYAVANSASQVAIVAPSSITPTGASMWFPTEVYVASTRLTHTSEQSLRAHNLDYRTALATTSSSIGYWYRPDNYQLKIYPGNNTGTSINITVVGAGIPLSPVADDTDSISLLPDDLLRQMLPQYAAIKLIMKNVDDQSMADRLGWRNWYDEHRMRLYMRLDPAMKAPYGPYSLPPVMGTGGK